MAYRLGVDVGGTFTDLFLVSEGDGGAQFRVKTPSTPADPSEGVLTGVRRICEEAGIGVGELRNILHGTTVATNAVLESKGARVGLITTQGFGQILHLARSQTPGPLAGWIIMIKPDPPASLADTREAVERMDARGGTVTAVDEQQVEAIVRDLVDSGVETFTVALINSYVNPAHEEQIGAIVERLYPGFPVTLSSHVLPEFREYERTLTACMNSYVRPKVADYVDRLQSELQAIGAKADVNILRSDAGLMTTTEAARNPIYGVLSGPSGGVAGALYVARKAGFDDILTFDMGGTSTDVALCQNGQPTIGRETAIGHFRIKVPSVNVHTVGAGGGSIAHVPELTKALRVGPQSAGADPGPAAYGKGGTEPTVTDANVVLGHLPPQLLGGEMELDVEAARAAVQTIADAMGLASVEEAAEGILAIVNENMAGALRLVSVQRGHDPRDFALVAYGGAGPLHANAVAKLMGSFPVIVPPAPGLLCAIGDLVADFRDEFAQTYIRLLADATPDEVAEILDDLGGRADAWLDSEGIADATRTVTYTADMRYHGQGYEIPVAIDPAEIRSVGVAGLEERFNGLHEQLYGFRMHGTASEIVNLRAVGFGAVPKPELAVGEPGGTDASGAVVDEHEVVFEGERTRRRSTTAPKLEPGALLGGPGDRDRVRLDDRRPPRLRGRGRRELQHPDHPQRLRGEGDDGSHRIRAAADRRDPDRRRGRPGHARHHRGRAEERPLRDGRRALPLGDEPRHPGAARRVPDDHRPARPHGRGPVRRLHQRDDGGLGPRRVPGRRDPHLRPVQVLGVDLAHERLARARADLLRGRARRLVEPVRPPDGRRRPAPGVAADGREDDLRGGDHHPAAQDRRARRGAGGRPPADPQQRPPAGDEPRRPVRDRRRLPRGREARDGALRALRQGDVPRRAAGAARPDLRGDADADPARDPRGAADVRGLHRRRRARQRPVQDEADDLARGRPRLLRLVGHRSAGPRARSTSTSPRACSRCSSGST